MKKNILITGGAGFIGSNLIEYLLSSELFQVTCIDNFDKYYSPLIKQKNIASFLEKKSFRLIETDINDAKYLADNLDSHYDVIIHLAARAGVRPSIQDPVLYQYVNVVGLQNMLEIARKKFVTKFIFGSSSSVYGINHNFPWKESDNDLMPVSPYPSSKIAGEWLGKTYSNLFGMRFIALRFFTVYGPKQRPDLAINNFTHKIINNIAIDLFGDGNTSRDYTYVDDIVMGIVSAINYDRSNFEIINLGNNYTVKLCDLIKCLEDIIGKEAIINYLPDQVGDVPNTYADISKAKELLDYNPQTKLENGLRKYVDWKMKSLIS